VDLLRRLPSDTLFDPALNNDDFGFQFNAYGYQFYLGAELLLARAFDLAAPKGTCSRLVRRVLSTAVLRCPGWTLGALASPRCTEFGFRSWPEVDDAHNVIVRLEEGWAWTSRWPWRFEFVPDYFDMVWKSNYGRVIGRLECCEKPRRFEAAFASCAGYAKCFPTEFLTFHRVCQAGHLAVSLRPLPHLPRAPTCWRVGMETDPEDLTALCLVPPD